MNLFQLIELIVVREMIFGKVSGRNGWSVRMKNVRYRCQ